VPQLRHAVVAMSRICVTALTIADVLLVRIPSISDSRGSFIETFNRRDFAEVGIDCEFVQDNESWSIMPGTVRGMHFQRPPCQQAKLVRVISGEIFDAVVDIRRGSPTFGRWCSATLSAKSGEQLFIPIGFAHGFCTLQPNTRVAYKVDGYYSPECDMGIMWNDPDINIAWPVNSDAAVVSDKDLRLPYLIATDSHFVYRN